MWLLTTLCALGAIACIVKAFLQREKGTSDSWYACFIGFLGMMIILGIAGQS